MANYKVILDWDLIARLAQLQCTEMEIAFACKCDHQTLLNHCIRTLGSTFEDFLGRNKDGGKVSLRRLQWDAAKGREGELLKDANGKTVTDDKGRPQWKVLPVAPNTTMQIWLGKQYLGQSDKNEVMGKDGGPVVIKEVIMVRPEEKG